MNDFPDLDSLSTSALIGECIMPRLDAETYVSDGEYRARMLRLVREQKAGGFCVFAELAESVVTAVQQLREAEKQRKGAPLIFSCDCEFGLRMRLKSEGTEFPDAMAIAHAGDPKLAFEVGRAIAREMRALGLSWNFAPVADVNCNPRNPIINTRSFGDDPLRVAEFAVPYMKGLQSGKVLATAKHFPGHGDTSVDSHHALPFIDGGLDRFETVELPPFKALIDAGVDSVMTGHLAAPKLAEELGAPAEECTMPTTLSRALTTTLLRERLGFTGVIVSDAMEMHAITKLVGDGEAAVITLLAGTDLVLMPVDPDGAFDAILKACEEKRISAGDVREHVRRVWALKEKAVKGLGPTNLPSLAKLESEHAPLAKEIASRAIEIHGTISLDGASLLMITDDRPIVVQKAKRFEELVRPRFIHIQNVSLAEWNAENVNLDENTVIATFHRARGYLGEGATERNIPRIMSDVAKRIKDKGMSPRGLVLIGSPYLDLDFHDATGFVLKTFSESMVSIEAAASILTKSQ